MYFHCGGGGGETEKKTISNGGSEVGYMKEKVEKKKRCFGYLAFRSKKKIEA